MGREHGYRIDLDAGVIRPGETLVISASRLGDTGSQVSVGVATGDVAPCDPVPAPAPPPES
jgi:hypothetical protein